MSAYRFLIFLTACNKFAGIFSLFTFLLSYCALLHVNGCLSILLVQLSGTHLEEGQVRAIVDGIKEVIVASTNRRIERAEREKAEDFDSEEEELLREENEQEDEIFDQVSY